MEHDLSGFTDASPRTPGGNLRQRLEAEVGHALVGGHCSTPLGSSLFLDLARSLRPQGAKRAERSALRSWLLTPAAPMRAELGSLIAGRGAQPEPELLHAALPSASVELRARIEAVLAFERFAWMIDSSFRELRRMSTWIGSTPITPIDASGNEILNAAADKLAGAFHGAADALAALDLAAAFEGQLGRFGEQMTPGELVENVMDHHERHQQSKPPRGKRPWFEEYGAGWVVRPPYRNDSIAALDPGVRFVHPYRVTALAQFLEDVAP